ncbi:hypothetical protein K458DRAFT_381579 [Lentithecium fluviatile CBS 122367]|uniref:Uncharacterized protein n=1 Tax=Lentithecium fluviatile CBS 122367 TaxID=1168545 RepID=A0A6G1JMT6_9PLEO|nr:hypothetical protein K458DRAFT_381579 [Lentithecium fluviatile CBS 122367]
MSDCMFPEATGPFTKGRAMRLTGPRSRETESRRGVSSIDFGGADATRMVLSPDISTALVFALTYCVFPESSLGHRTRAISFTLLFRWHLRKRRIGAPYFHARADENLLKSTCSKYCGAASTPQHLFLVYPAERPGPRTPDESTASISLWT